jgi:hypothetical protein
MGASDGGPGGYDEFPHHPRSTSGTTVTKEVEKEKVMVEAWRVNRAIQGLYLLSGVEEFNSIRREGVQEAKMKSRYFEMGKAEALYELGQSLSPGLKSGEIIEGEIIKADVSEDAMRKTLCTLREKYEKDILLTEDTLKEERLRGRIKVLKDVGDMLMLYEYRVNPEIGAKKRS